MTGTATLRPARPEDAQTLVDLVRELAEYEKLAHEAVATDDDFRRHLFGPNAAAGAIVAEVDGVPVGFALYFGTFSTFRGQPGLYLEDLFVQPGHRGRGLGKALIAEVAAEAVRRGCGRLEWAVLDWNAPSIAFYRSLDAQEMDEWTTFRLADEPLTTLAKSAGTSLGPPTP